MPFNLPRSYRLLKADEFSSVFSFRRGVSGEFFQIQVKPNGLSHPRLGMVVGRKTEKLAVNRNFAKRVVREYFRANPEKFEGLDVVVRLRKPLRKACPAVVRQELHELASRVGHVASLDRAD
ncbi:MAG TPA: ribonuclease P protein component [Burkholderiales bacterium]|nr:ribonuclease P protein component [Burkholderiales bacterium]